MKTIFITSFHPLVSRNILSAPFFGMLAARSGVRIVLIVPNAKREFFERFYKKENVVVEGVARKLNQADYFFKDLIAASLVTPTRRRIRAMRLGNERWNMLRLLFWAPLIRRFIPRLYAFFMPKHRYADVFLKYAPSLVFATDIFNPMDAIFMHEAKMRGIGTVGMVRSWDNLTGKGGFRVVPETLVVQNEIIKQEAMTLHFIPERKIRAVGIPHYDTRDAPLSREEFLRKIGIPADGKYILYAPVGDRFFTENTFDREMVMLLRTMLPEGFFLVVRPPPGDPADMEGVPADPRIIIDEPGTRFPWAGERKIDTELSPEDDRWLTATIAHAELLVSGVTTLMLDAARADKPIVVVGFDAKTPLPYAQSVCRHLEFNHFEPVRAQGGVRVVHNETELASVINEYRTHPEHDRAARRRMFLEQCFRDDGKSSGRLLQVILEKIKM